MKAALVFNSALPGNMARKICVMFCLTEDWNASWNLQDGLPWSLRCLWEVDAAPQASWLCQQQISNPCPHEWFHSMNEIIVQPHNNVWGWDIHYLATAPLQPSAAASSPCCNLSDTSCVPIPHSLLLVQMVPFYLQYRAYWSLSASEHRWIPQGLHAQKITQSISWIPDISGGQEISLFN